MRYGGYSYTELDFLISTSEWRKAKIKISVNLVSSLPGQLHNYCVWYSSTYVLNEVCK